MASAAPGDFFKRKANAPQVRTIRRFSDVETDSDIDFDEDKPSKHSVASLSFKTETTEKLAGEDPRPPKSAHPKSVEATSEGSILFESGSEQDLPLEEAPAAAPTVAAEAAPPAHPPHSSFPKTQQPSSLAEKFFGNVSALKGQTTTPNAQHKGQQQQQRQQQQQEQRQQRAPPARQEPPPPQEQQIVAEEPRRAPPVEKKAAVASAQPTQAPTSTSHHRTGPPPPQQPPPREEEAPQRTSLVASREHANGGKSDNTAEGAATPHSDSERNDTGDASDRRSDAGFAEHVLPTDQESRRRRTSAGHPLPPQQGSPAAEGGMGNRLSYPVVEDGNFATPLARSSRVDASDDLLVRARLRLEEKRRVEAGAAMASRLGTPNRRSVGAASSNGLLLSGRRSGNSPRGTSHYAVPATPTEAPPAAYRYDISGPDTHGVGGPTPFRSGGARVTGVDAHMVDAKLHRLSQENTRLQDEITFLNRENQKLRSVAGSADSAENVKMQLTVDLLRKELQSKEMDHQSDMRAKEAEKGLLAAQVAELQDQNEGYAATASQYRSLYEEKAKEIESLKVKLQRHGQDFDALEYRLETDAQQRQRELAMEREKMDKLLYLIDDLKKQRQHLHELNQEVQVELAGVKDEKARLAEALGSAEERYRQARSAQEQAVETLQQDVARLNSMLKEKDRNHTAQLGEEQRVHAKLQQRLDESLADGRQEVEQLRRSLEASREEQKRALDDERARRSLTEEKLRKAEADFKAALSTFKETAVAEHETKVRQLREDVVRERQAREAAQLDADRMADEVERARESLAYQSAQYQTLSEDFAHSEEMRDEAERRCGALTTTLSDMMHNDSEQTRRIAQLEASLAELRQQLSDAALVIPGVAGCLDGPRGAGGNSIAAQLQMMSSENARLTNECVRLAGERDALVDENGKIAEELLKWKNEMRTFVSTQLKQPQ